MSFSLLKCYRRSIPFLCKITLKPSTITTNPSIRLMSMGLDRKERNFINNERRTMEKDQVPKDFTLIYKSDAHNYTIVAVACILIGSTIFLISAIIGHHTGNMYIPRNLKYSNYLATTTNEELYSFGYLLAFLVIICFVICHRFMVRIYNKGDKYIGFYQGYLPWTTRRLDFEVGDAKVKGPTWYYTISDYKIKGQKTILDENMFRTPADCHKMMGGVLRQEEDEER